MSTTRIEELRNVVRDARALTELPDDFMQLKNLSENSLLQEMIDPDSTDESIEMVIKSYMDSRLKMCMVNKGFSKKVQETKNGHFYLKVLRERVLEELGLTTEAKYRDLSFERLYESLPENR